MNMRNTFPKQVNSARGNEKQNFGGKCMAVLKIKLSVQWIYRKTLTLQA